MLGKGQGEEDEVSNGEDEEVLNKDDAGDSDGDRDAQHAALGMHAHRNAETLSPATWTQRVMSDVAVTAGREATSAVHADKTQQVRQRQPAFTAQSRLTKAVGVCATCMAVYSRIHQWQQLDNHPHASHASRNPFDNAPRQRTTKLQARTRRGPARHARQLSLHSTLSLAGQAAVFVTQATPCAAHTAKDDAGDGRGMKQGMKKGMKQGRRQGSSLQSYSSQQATTATACSHSMRQATTLHPPWRPAGVVVRAQGEGQS